MKPGEGDPIGIRFTAHAEERIAERAINRAHVVDAVKAPTQLRHQPVGTTLMYTVVHDGRRRRWLAVAVQPPGRRGEAIVLSTWYVERGERPVVGVQRQIRGERRDREAQRRRRRRVRRSGHSRDALE